MSDDHRTHERLRRYLNGRWDEMDDTTRSAFIVLADEFDGLHNAIRGVRRLLWTIGSSVVTSTLGLIVVLITQR